MPEVHVATTFVQHSVQEALPLLWLTLCVCTRQLDTSGNSEARLFIANGCRCRSRSTSRTPPLSTSVGRVAFQLQQGDSPRNLQQLEQQRHRRSGSDCSVSSGARGVYTTALTTGATSSSSNNSSSAAHKRSQQQHNDANTVIGDILATGAANHAYSTTVAAGRNGGDNSSSSANTGTGSSSAAVTAINSTSGRSVPMTVTGPKRVWAGPFARLTAAANSSIISAITGITGGRLASSHTSSDSGVITSKCYLVLLLRMLYLCNAIIVTLCNSVQHVHATISCQQLACVQCWCMHAPLT
jgi:hypothetical protein